ncbi:MAG: hypothetical protein RIC95_09355 [Vicingaceae bacterium]
MNTDKLIGNILELKKYEEFKEEGRSSNLIIALRGARKLTGRDIKTGKLLSKKESLNKMNQDFKDGTYHSSLFLGLVNYLIILDLIGSLFSKQTANKQRKNGLENALENFTVLKKEEKDAIKELRNSLAHNFGLGQPKNIFSLSNSYPKMISLPESKNDFFVTKSKSKDSYTKINDVKLCSFVEEVFNEVKKCFGSNELKLKNGLNEQEIKSRFTFL